MHKIEERSREKLSLQQSQLTVWLSKVRAVCSSALGFFIVPQGSCRIFGFHFGLESEGKGPSVAEYPLCFAYT